MDRDQLIAEIKKQLKEELKAYAQPLADKIPDEQKEQALEIKNEVSRFVKENPWASVGIAALAGFVLARLLYKKGED